LRNLTIDDAAGIFALNLDKEVLKYTGDQAFENIQATKDFYLNTTNMKNTASGDLR
jgi:ribosomal-protein-alanine N-acetyltransferase